MCYKDWWTDTQPMRNFLGQAANQNISQPQRQKIRSINHSVGQQITQ